MSDGSVSDGSVSDGGIGNAGPSDEVLHARAYLSRVCEPACIPLWDLVRAAGPVAAVESIRTRTASAEVLAVTDARHASVEPGADLEAAHRRGIRLVAPESPDWPHFALACLEREGERRVDQYRAGQRKHEDYGEPIPPLALWVRGSADLAGLATRSVGIVGARASTPYGDQVARELSYGLAERGFTVVSGGAYGIDAAAHRAALAADAVTVLVSAGGLDRAYPTAHDKLYEQIAETGLLISESPPGAAPQRHRFLTRNRLITAFSTGTVVVEAAARSGALNTARHCRRLGRPLMAVPGPVTSALSAGTHGILQSDVGDSHLVTSVSDVLAVIGAAGEGLDPVVPSSEPENAGQRHGRLRAILDGLDDGSRRVYDGLPARRPISVTELVQTTGLAARQVMAVLPVLTLHGLARFSPEGVSRVVLRTPSTPTAAATGDP